MKYMIEWAVGERSMIVEYDGSRGGFAVASKENDWEGHSVLFELIGKLETLEDSWLYCMCFW